MSMSNYLKSNIKACKYDNNKSNVFIAIQIMLRLFQLKKKIHTIENMAGQHCMGQSLLIII